MTLTIKIRSSSANSASMDDRLRDVLNENLKSNSPLPFSDWKQTWKDRYPNQHTGGQETATYIYFTACLLLAYINYYIAIQYCWSVFDNLSIVVDVWFIGQRIFLSFHSFFFFSRISFLFFNVSVVDTRVVGLVTRDYLAPACWIKLFFSCNSRGSGFVCH